MRRRTRDRNVIFDVVHGALTRTVTFPDGHAYTHRCTREVYEHVAHTIEEHATSGGQGVTLEPLVRTMDAPHTQVSVALDFMLERGCLTTRLRRHYAASGCLFEDAMCEFLFLAELPY